MNNGNEERRPAAEPDGARNLIADDDNSNDTATMPAHGGDIAAITANPSQLAALIADIEAKAAGGRYVCACSVYPLSKDVGTTDTPNVVGAAFRTAALHGVIKPIGYHRATRSARQSGVHGQWVGVVA